MIVNKKQLSEIVGVSERTLTEWQDDGMPVELIGGRGMENQYETAKVIEWRVQRAVAGKSKMTPRDERDFYQARMTQLELIVASGKVATIEDIARAWGGAILAAKSEMLGLGPRIKSILDSRYSMSVDQELIDAEVRNCLTKLAETDPVTDTADDADEYEDDDDPGTG